MSKAIKKIVEEARDNAYTEIDLADREIKSLNSVPILRKLWKVLEYKYLMYQTSMFVVRYFS
jgi:hypothetical protein